MTEKEARDEREPDYASVTINGRTDTFPRGSLGYELVMLSVRKHPEPEITEHIQRFAEGAAEQFRSDLDYDGAEIKRRILMDAHIIGADHPGEGEPCAVCEHDDRLDNTDNEDQR